MKIATYVDSWPPGTAPTGIVTYASHLVPALRQLGHEVFVLTQNLKATEDDRYAIDVRRFSPRPTLWSRAMRKLAPGPSGFRAMSTAVASAMEYLVDKHGVEVLEMEESFGWTFKTSKLRRVPVVVRLHGPWFLTGRYNDPGNNDAVNWRRAELEGRSILAAHMVSANCMDTLRLVREHYGAEIKNARIVPTPLDAADQAKAWNLDACTKDTILFVGRFDKLKGGDLVLRVFERLAKTNSRLRLTFVGPDKGIVEADGATLKYDQFAERYLPPSIRSRVNFRGRTDHAEVMSIRTSHYLTLIAAQFDTFGYMLLEPMSLGCPLVTTAVGGIPEAIKDGRNGLLVPSQDEDAMVAACAKLLDDPALAARIGHQAWCDCRDKYGSEIVAKQMLEVYREAIDTFKR
jgi:glycosyltransferase involved in cell wall biosynthesis